LVPLLPPSLNQLVHKKRNNFYLFWFTNFFLLYFLVFLRCSISLQLLGIWGFEGSQNDGPHHLGGGRGGGALLHAHINDEDGGAGGFRRDYGGQGAKGAPRALPGMEI
jgi:hypothetical protein